MSNGDGGGGGFDFSGLFDALFAGLLQVIAAIINFLVSLVSVLVQVLNFLFQGELGIFGFSQSGLDRIWRGLKNIMDQVFHVWVVKALQHLLDLYNKLAKWVAKLKAWLDKLRQIQQRLQVGALRDFINLIQRIRKVLVVFRLLHIGFATKLDNWLAGIEGTLISRIADYQRKTNEIISWLNVIADPRQAYRKGILFGAYGRIFTGMDGALGAIGLKGFFPFLQQNVGADTPTRPWSAVVQQFDDESKNNSGDWGGFKAQSDQYRALFDQGFGTTSPP